MLEPERFLNAVLLEDTLYKWLIDRNKHDGLISYIEPDNKMELDKSLCALNTAHVHIYSILDQISNI